VAEPNLTSERAQMHAELDRLLDEAAGYEGTANATRDAAVLVFNHCASELGLTGFQGSWAALQAYWKVMGYRGGGLVLKDEDLRYPQYDHYERLREHLSSPGLVRWLGDEAERLLIETHQKNAFAAGRVIDHWRALVAARDALPAEEVSPGDRT
jgi:hypothetical protein